MEWCFLHAGDERGLESDVLVSRLFLDDSGIIERMRDGEAVEESVEVMWLVAQVG